VIELVYLVWKEQIPRSPHQGLGNGSQTKVHY